MLGATTIGHIINLAETNRLPSPSESSSGTILSQGIIDARGVSEGRSRGSVCRGKLLQIVRKAVLAEEHALL
jgi:hypothetical protein